MKKLFFLFMALIAFTACSTFSVLDSRVYNNADLANYHTFAIAQPEQSNFPAGMTMRDFDALATSIRTQMIRRGYKESANPDLLVYIGITVVDRVQTKEAIPPATPYYFGRRAAWLRNYYSDAKLITGVDKEGTVSVDIVDVKNQQVAYAGAVGSVMDRQQHIRDLDELNKAMDALFKNYPIKPEY
ncbi:MAG: DUF4136 domain-containing protein [Bacteroidales bacterium]